MDCRYRRLSALLVLLCACHKDEPDGAAPKPIVRVMVTVRAARSARVPISGVLSPLPGRDVKIGSMVAGRVDRVFVAEGDVVKVGQALAHVEAQPLRDRVTEAQAQHATSSAALDNARTRLQRAEKLFADGIASKQEVDDAHAALVAAQSAVAQAQAGTGTASVQLERATLRAPIDGVVAAILVPAGQPVDGNATPVLEVADTRELDLRAPVPASHAADVVVDQRAELLIENVGRVEGRVVAIAPLVDTATNTVAVRVRVLNDKGRLRGGLFTRGALLGAPRDAIVIPPTALLPGDGGAASVVAILSTDGTIAHRNVIVRSEDDDATEVEGLEPGVRVVIAGGYALPDGTKVDIAP